MKKVFVLQHEYERFDSTESKLIGVYLSRYEAEEAIRKLRPLPGFRDWLDGFTITEYAPGETHWAEGFVITVYLLLPTIDDQAYHPAASSWSGGDRYEITGIEDGIDPELLRYKVGDIVECVEQVTEDGTRCLVANRLSLQKKTGVA